MPVLHIIAKRIRIIASVVISHDILDLLPIHISTNHTEHTKKTLQMVRRYAINNTNHKTDLFLYAIFDICIPLTYSLCELCELKCRKYLKYLRVCNLLSSYCYFDCIHLISIYIYKWLLLLNIYLSTCFYLHHSEL